LNISEFYDEDLARRDSDEEGFGDGWSTEADQHSTYRANWLRDTGELYVVREPHPGGLFARYLDQLDIDQVDVEELTVEVLGRFEDEAGVQRALAGWQKEMTQPDSLVWLRERTAAAAA
jgi:hypothetical protein